MALKPSAPSADQDAPEADDVAAPIQDAAAPDADPIIADDDADPSPAADAKEPETLGDVVRSVLEKNKDEEKPEEGSSASEVQDASKPTDGDATPAEKPETPEEAEKPPPFHKHPRWQSMVAERDGFRAEAEGLRENAGRFEQIQAYQTRYELSNEEVAEGYKIMALMRQDPAGAYAALQPYISRLEEFMGVTLPEDLAEDVERGAITGERAAELAAARSRATFSQGREAATRARVERQSQYETVSRAAAAVGSAVEGWVNSWRGSDPDFDAKHGPVHDRIEVLISRAEKSGQAITPDGALAMCKQAKIDVDAQVKALTPKGKARTERRSDLDRDPTSVSAQPKNIKDAIRLAASGQYVASAVKSVRAGTQQ